MEEVSLMFIFVCHFKNRPIPNIYKALSSVFPSKSSIIHLNIKSDPAIRIFYYR